jgi:transcriptional regulator GlxA family with amidase domain
MGIASKAPHPIVFEILLRPGFVGLEATMIIDALRITNRIYGAKAFDWYTSADQAGMVESSGGMFFNARDFAHIPTNPYVLIVPGNKDGTFLGKAAKNRISRLRREGCQVILLAEAAAEYIGHLRSDSGPVTTHWENKAVLLEQYIGANIADTFVEHHDGMTTSAGMGTTIDLMFMLIAEHVPLPVVRTVGAVFLHDHIRPSNTPQPSQRATILTQWDPALGQAITMMEDALESDLRINEIAADLGVSVRSLERKFGAAFGIPPMSFFRDLRLNKALSLVNSTNMPLVEVALSCGLGDPNRLSKLFRKKFSVTPAALRKKQPREVSKKKPQD